MKFQKQEIKIKIFICVKVATQNDGDLIFVTTEGAFQNKDKAEKFFMEKSKTWQEHIPVEGVNVLCSCMRALHEINLITEGENV